MTFKPLEFEILSTNTLNLEGEFSTKLGRYKIVDHAAAQSTSPILKKRNSLELLILKTQQVIDCKTNRLTARDVFNQLVNELREVLKHNHEEDIEESTLFLLGALLHRYFRLIAEYDTYNSYMYFYATDVKNCKLFQSIRNALGLPQLMGVDYREKDLELIDVTTIVTSLEVFQENMLLKDEKQIPKFKKYPHFEKDVNFELYLQGIIDQHKLVGAPVLNQFKGINFIKSLAVQMNNDQREIDEALQAWSNTLDKHAQNFNLLTHEYLESHISTHVISPVLKGRILGLFNTDYIRTRLGALTLEDFLLAMKSCHATKASYILTGGYSLLLRSESITTLTFCINQALGIEDEPELFDDKEKLRSIRFLKEYLKQNPVAVLDYEFFAGKEKMDTFISQNEEALVNSVRIQKKSEERSSLHV